MKSIFNVFRTMLYPIRDLAKVRHAVILFEQFFPFKLAKDVDRMMEVENNHLPLRDR